MKNLIAKLSSPLLWFILAIAIQILGAMIYRWSWLAAFGPTRTLPESWDITAPMLILGSIGFFGLITSLVAIHRSILVARWWLAIPAVLVMLPCAWWSGVCLYAVCIFGGWA